MGRAFLIIAGISGFLAVSFGAFGAHILKAQLSAQMMEVFQTAVSYHFYHSLALILTAILLMQHAHNAYFRASGWFYVIGIIIFSGSLYALSLTGIRGLGAITPIGGVAFLIAWLCLTLGTLKIAP